MVGFSKGHRFIALRQPLARLSDGGAIFRENGFEGEFRGGYISAMFLVSCVEAYGFF